MCSYGTVHRQTIRLSTTRFARFSELVLSSFGVFRSKFGLQVETEDSLWCFRARFGVASEYFGVASDLKSCHQMVRYDALRFLIAMLGSRLGRRIGNVRKQHSRSCYKSCCTGRVNIGTLTYCTRRSGIRDTCLAADFTSFTSNYAGAIHFPKVVGSNPAPATKNFLGRKLNGFWAFLLLIDMTRIHLCLRRNGAERKQGRLNRVYLRQDYSSKLKNF